MSPGRAPARSRHARWYAGLAVHVFDVPIELHDRSLRLGLPPALAREAMLSEMPGQ